MGGWFSTTEQLNKNTHDYDCPPGTSEKTSKQLGCKINTCPQPRTIDLHAEPKQIYLVTTHNTRLQCFIYYLINTLPNEILADKLKEIKGKKFMNCVVLNVIITRGIVKINMIHEGELDQTELNKLTPDKKAKYWTIETFNNFFNLLEFTLGFLNITHNFQLLFLRHGQGFHNLPENKGKLSKAAAIVVNKIRSNDENPYFDSPLTYIGREQAARAATRIKPILGGRKIEAVFVSILNRTHETAAVFINTIGDHSHISTFYVLHCNHEIGEPKDNGICDKKDNKMELTDNGAGENKSKCVDNSFAPINRSECKLTTIGGTKYTINWEFYMKTYNEECSKKNLIEEIIRAFYFLSLVKVQLSPQQIIVLLKDFTNNECQYSKQFLYDAMMGMKTLDEAKFVEIFNDKLLYNVMMGMKTLDEAKFVEIFNDKLLYNVIMGMKTLDKAKLFEIRTILHEKFSKDGTFKNIVNKLLPLTDTEKNINVHIDVTLANARQKNTKYLSYGEKYLKYDYQQADNPSLDKDAKHLYLKYKQKYLNLKNNI